jgi:hypothetical protein
MFDWSEKCWPKSFQKMFCIFRNVPIFWVISGLFKRHFTVFWKKSLAKSLLTQIWSTRKSARMRGSHLIICCSPSASTSQTGWTNQSDWFLLEDCVDLEILAPEGPIEAMELELFWDWQATQNALKCRRDEGRAELWLEKLELERWKIKWQIVLIWSWLTLDPP